MAEKKPDTTVASTGKKGVWLTLAFGLGVLLCFWLSTGFYRLDAGQQALVYKRGQAESVVKTVGMHWHLPIPLSYHQVYPAPARYVLQAGGTSDTAILSQDGGLLAVSYQQDYTLTDIKLYVQVGDADSKVTDMRLQAAIQMALHQELANHTWLSVLKMPPAALAQRVNARVKALLTASPGVAFGALRIDSIEPLGDTKALFTQYQERQAKLQSQIKTIEEKAKPHYPLYQKQADALLVAAKQEAQHIQLKTQADIAQLSPLLEQDAQNPSLTRAFVRNQGLFKTVQNKALSVPDVSLSQLLEQVSQAPVVSKQNSSDDSRQDRPDRSTR